MDHKKYISGEEKAWNIITIMMSSPQKGLIIYFSLCASYPQYVCSSLSTKWFVGCNNFYLAFYVFMKNTEKCIKYFLYLQSFPKHTVESWRWWWCSWCNSVQQISIHFECVNAKGKIPKSLYKFNILDHGGMWSGTFWWRWCMHSL